MIKFIIRSSIFFLGNIFRKRQYDILFYYPSHFNRGKNGENEFFQPFYKLCEKYNISYLALEEPDFNRKTVRNKNAVCFDFPLILILITRKIIPLQKFQSFEERDWFIAKILKPFLFRNFHFKNYIVLSNSMLGFFRGLNKEASLYDYQHGVIYSHHIGYFTGESTTPAHIKENGANLLLYGEAFRRVLIKNTIDDYYKTHTYVLGNDKLSRIPSKPDTTDSNTILFSLQFTSIGDDKEKQYKWLKIIDDFLTNEQSFFLKNNITIIMKNHPRFDGSIDISPLRNFEFVKFKDEDLFQLLDESYLHITFFSSTIFEASAKGIPTILWDGPESNAQVYINDFHYPLGTTYTPNIVGTIQRYKENPNIYKQDCDNVLFWHKTIYSPINEQLFQKLFSNSMKEV